MLLKWLNIVAGLFGYKWIVDTRPDNLPDEELLADEDWDDIQAHGPRYHLVKKD